MNINKMRVPHLKNDLVRAVSFYQNKEYEKQFLQAGSIYLEQWRKKRFQLVHQLENAVSVLQIAYLESKNIIHILIEIKQVLNNLEYKDSSPLFSESVIQNFLDHQFQKIENIAYSSSFNNRNVLNGDMGVQGKANGNNLYFVKGGNGTKSSNLYGYPVSIFQIAENSTLIGYEPLDFKNLQSEKMISLFEGKNTLHYKIKDEENPESFIQHLQECILENGLDLSVYCTNDEHLLIMHNQSGSNIHFSGVSYKSKILSKNPGEITHCIIGKDIKGNIVGEKTIGYGNFLIGAKGNKNTEDLTLYYNGSLKYPGEIIGNVEVFQNGIEVPLSLENKSKEIIQFPSLLPQKLSIGIINSSKFNNLAQIRIKNKIQQKDAIKLISASIHNIEQLQAGWKNQENFFVNTAIQFLKNSMNLKYPTNETLITSKEKADQMAEDLKSLLASKEV